VTPRKRILSTIERRSPDRLPVGFKASIDILERLQNELGATSLHGLIDSLPVDTFGLFNNSMVGIFPVYVGGPKRVMYPDSYPDGTWDTMFGYKRRWKKSATGKNEEVISNPLADAADKADLEKYPWPQANWFDYSKMAQDSQQAGDKAVIFLAGSLWQAAHLVGYEHLLMQMVADPLFVETCFDKLGEFFAEFTRKSLKAADGRIDIVCVQDDMGTQAGPLISPALYRRFFKAHHKKIYDVAHDFGAKVMQHSCGAVVEFIPDFIDIGVDILDPVQTSAAGMDPRQLKREFGRDLCFHGGIDTQHTLIKGTPEDVVREIDSLVETFASGGGYIIAPSHYIQSDTPWENLTAMFDHINKLRGN
jgi:uroporphyrinogen decarboxylase